jgi:hypothetical protein
LLVATAALALLACGGDSGDGGDQDETATAVVAAPASPTTVPTKAVVTVAPDLPAPVMLALETAARDAGVPVDQVELLQVEEVEWRTSGLGCEQPGMAYAQVITPGYLVRVRVAGDEVAYHTDIRTTVIRCDAT